MTPRKIQEKIFPKVYAAELLNIAKGDWHSANALSHQQEGRIENIFFLAHQSIEKSLKAVLCHLGSPVPLIYELSGLIAKFPDTIDLPFGYELDQLTQFATIRRYEEGKIALTEAEKIAVLERTKTILEWAEEQLGLS